MPLADRDYMRDQYPPACTCKECTETRLGKLRKRTYDEETPGMTVKWQTIVFPLILLAIIAAVIYFSVR